jgi:hypothetical protein
MLLLSRSGDWYPDDEMPSVRYRLPTNLFPLPAADGTPQATLTRSPDGGVLQIRLGAVWPSFRERDRPVPFDGGRFRLLLQTPVARESGEWHPTTVMGDLLVDRSVSLSPTELAIAQHLGAQSGDVVDVEVELTFRGLAPGLPWMVSVPTEIVRARVSALLGSAPASGEAVDAAFLGLPEEIFAWYPLEAGAIRPPRDAALIEIARHMAPLLLESTESGWVMGSGGPSRIDVNLRVARVRTEQAGFRWSFSEFLASAPSGQHLVDVSVPAPFVAGEISVVNDLPLAPSGVSSLAVDVRTGGPTGLLHHEFRPGQPGAVRLRYVRETQDAPPIEWKARLTVMTAGGPVIQETEFRRSGPLIEANSVTLGITALRFFAEPDVFDHVQKLSVGIGARTLTLTRLSPEAWAAGRRPPPTVVVSALLESGQTHPLGSLPIGARGLTIGVGLLGVGETGAVVLMPPPDQARRLAYLAVQVEGQSWHTIDPETNLTAQVRRHNRFLPSPLRYRTRSVARGADGGTTVMAESPWRDAAGEAVSIQV